MACEVRFFTAAEHAAAHAAMVNPGPAERYLLGLLRTPPAELLDNAGAVRIELMRVDDQWIPLVINDGADEDCYLVSAHGHYLSYLAVEVERLSPSPERAALRTLLPVMSTTARLLRFNRSVSVHNWLLSTSPRLDLPEAALIAARDALVARFPGHALQWRNLDATETGLAERFAHAGFQLPIHRPVHAWNPADFSSLHAKKRGNIRRDLAHRDRAGMVVRDLTAADADLAEVLCDRYRALYVDKHSALNPQLRPACLRLHLASGYQRVFVLERGGVVLGFGAYIDEARITPTIIGYDTSDDDAGVYRAILATLFERSLATGKPLFLSTGAARFKLLRGSRESLELEPTYTAHLPLWRRLPWRGVERLFAFGAARLDSSEI